ncbi:MAG TPA: hypothetical protein DCZ91_16785 [Lachnospiraceae bacterium]|nr:hypothetical protein [Lachnospiraceae bacterium]
MLEYDEWVVPGEVEYATKKDTEIKRAIEKYHRDFNTFEYRECCIYIRITEHIVGKYDIMIPESVWYLPDIHLTNDMKLDWFRDEVVAIDAPKIFDLPDDDIRSTLPEWDDSLLPDDSRRDIMNEHYIRYKAISKVGDIIEYGIDRYMQEKLNISKPRANRIAEAFMKKLETTDKRVEFTEVEERISDYFEENGYYDYIYGRYFNNYGYFQRHYGVNPRHFPLRMTEEDIINAVQEAYRNAGKRSRRIIPGVDDAVNMANLCTNYEYQYIENYQCLYQGRAGEMVIRFLFDFKNMKIVNAYPLMMNGNAKKHAQ